MALPKFKPVANASPGTKKTLRLVFGGLLGILAAAFGLELSNNDWDVGKIAKGAPPSEAKILRDQKGNIRRDSLGQILTRVMRDKNGNVVPDGTPGAKHTDEYNCSDFSTQPEAQRFFDNAGGLGHDTNVLDGDKDGIACESLPKGAKK
jgi:hypothetical protein